MGAEEDMKGGGCARRTVWRLTLRVVVFSLNSGDFAEVARKGRHMVQDRINVGQAPKGCIPRAIKKRLKSGDAFVACSMTPRSRPAALPASETFKTSTP